MATRLASRKDAISALLNKEFADLGVFFNVTLTRATTKNPSTINVEWTVYPAEEQVLGILGDLATGDVTLTRRQVWSCGYFHRSPRDAWEDHEGAHLLKYPDSHIDPHGICAPSLPEDVEDELIAAGETFESDCHPGNYRPCPTCGGEGSLRDHRTFKLSPCPDCVRLGTDKALIARGMLNLDNAEHRAFHEAKVTELRTSRDAKNAAEQRKVDAAMLVPTTTAIPVWIALPTRDAGRVNNVPVHTRVGCDYMHHHGTDKQRSCGNKAAWFDPTTGLRVCTSHKNSGR